MHACKLTWAYISGYGAYAGPNNGQATKGNGIRYMSVTLIYNMRATLRFHMRVKYIQHVIAMHVIEHEPIFQVMVLTLDQIMDKEPKETVYYVHACYIHVKHVCYIIYNMLLLACNWTQIYNSGYGAHAGPNNGQATKGNGILHTCLLHTYKTCVT